MTKYEYYIAIADITTQIIPYLDSPNLQVFYKGAAEQFVKRAKDLTKEEVSEPASKSNLEVYKHYQDKLREFKARQEEVNAGR